MNNRNGLEIRLPTSFQLPSKWEWKDLIWIARGRIMVAWKSASRVVSYRGTDRNFSSSVRQGREYLPTNRKPRLISTRRFAHDTYLPRSHVGRCTWILLKHSDNSLLTCIHVRCVIHVTRVPKFPVIVRSIVSCRGDARALVVCVCVRETQLAAKRATTLTVSEKMHYARWRVGKKRRSIGL